MLVDARTATLALGRAGARIVACDVNAAELPETVDSAGPACTAVELDVTNTCERRGDEGAVLLDGARVRRRAEEGPQPMGRQSLVSIVLITWIIAAALASCLLAVVSGFEVSLVCIKQRRSLVSAINHVKHEVLLGRMNLTPKVFG